MSGMRIAAARLWLPECRESADQAVAQGLADRQEVERDGYLELPVSHDLGAPEMAVHAAGPALGDAGVSPESVDFLAHAWIYHQGHDFWSPAHYVAAGVAALRAIPLGIQQMCNGGVAAVQVAMDRMAADPSLGTAVVTTADRFAAPAFKRWRADYGVAYGDGATALVLDREHGPYTVEAITTAAAPELERMHRGDDAFSASAREHGADIDIRRTKKAFLTAGGGPRFTAAVADAVRTVVIQALETAGIGPGDPALRYIALPRLGRSVLAQAYLPALYELTRAEPLDFGRTTGHLGAGDAAANIAQIHTGRLLLPGQYALILSAGAGFTWSCLAIRAS